MRYSALKVLEANNVSEPPINIYQMLDSEDIQVDFWPFRDSDIEGLYLRNITGSGVAINANHPRVKQRFTAAHELKHHLHDVPDDGSPINPCLSSYAKRHIERKANAFAAELLVPPPMLQSAIRELGDDLLTITTLASAFRVSYEVMVYRLNTLRFIDDRQKKQLLSPSYRRDDKNESLSHREMKNAAKIRTSALLMALGHFDEYTYCKNCSSVILFSQWKLCPECGTTLL